MDIIALRLQDAIKILDEARSASTRQPLLPDVIYDLIDDATRAVTFAIDGIRNLPTTEVAS